ncbi:MAG: hypothetical protein K6F00_11125 [Lachnospiraceae bacterium]|nr:hypothetical protein [Lachnospiraceae bacterium]
MLVVVYRDELGPVMEVVEDEPIISFLEGKAYFNDTVIDINNLIRIGIEEGNIINHEKN